MNTSVSHETEPGLPVFDIRLGLTILDTIGSAHPGTRSMVDDLSRRTTAARDGHAAREALADDLFTALATDRRAEEYRDLVGACGLGTGALSDEHAAALATGLETSEAVITRSLAATAPSSIY